LVIWEAVVQSISGGKQTWAHLLNKKSVQRSN